MAKKGKGTKKNSGLRRLSRKAGLVLAALLAVYAAVGTWYVHHPRAWLAERSESWPGFVTWSLFAVGSPVGDVTDALALTGHDAVYEYDEPAPAGSVLFAGAPARTGAPAPTDIVTLERGQFKVGWSPSLRHPVWCAYHVRRDAAHEAGKRPNFVRDRSVPESPKPTDYERSGYDRGHMVPNYAMVTRYGTDEQKKTFLMTNVAPQTPALNRGVWRNFEHRIADLWTRRYGEIWVIVGCLSDGRGGETVSGTDIDVPRACYQLIVAQEGMDVRALAVIFGQNVPWSAYPTHYIVSIDELERLTGLDFLPDLPSFIQSPLEAETPTRLWPICPGDILKLILLRFT